jgi:hypothetical protein
MPALQARPVSTRSGATPSPGNTTTGCHCGSASRASKSGCTAVRAQPKAKVSATTSAISQPVLLGLSASVSPISRHTPARVGTGRAQGAQAVAGQQAAAKPRGAQACDGMVHAAIPWEAENKRMLQM